MQAGHRYARSIAWGVCATALICVATDMPAQVIHRQVDADGRVTYTDRPDMAALAATPTGLAPDVTSALTGNSAMSSRGAARVDANEAARRLQQAQRERGQGAERLPGEQARGADAAAANLRYSQRQDELRRLVEQAQRRSSEADRLLRARL